MTYAQCGIGSAILIRRPRRRRRIQVLDARQVQRMQVEVEEEEDGAGCEDGQRTSTLHSARETWPIIRRWCPLSGKRLSLVRERAVVQVHACLNRTKNEGEVQVDERLVVYNNKKAA